MSWEDVEAAIGEAKSIAFDGCHKIYLLMDDAQTAVMKDCGYGDGDSRLIEFEPSAQADMLAILHEWFDESCFLKFVYAVKTVDGDPNDGFTALISQGEYEDEEDE